MEKKLSQWSESDIKAICVSALKEALDSYGIVPINGAKDVVKPRIIESGDRIIVPFGAKSRLVDEFKVSRPTVERWLLGGGGYRLEDKRRCLRQRAIELGGAVLAD